MTIIFFNRKGGVAKTTSTFNIGAALREQGSTVELLVIDKQRNLIDGRFVTPDELAEIISQSRADYVLVDCPPTLEEYEKPALRCADLVLIPLQPEAYAYGGMNNLLQVMEEVHAEGHSFDFRILITMFDTRAKSHKAIEKGARERFRWRVLPTHIRLNSKIRDSVYENKNVLEYAPTSDGAKDYRAATAELLEVL